MATALATLIADVMKRPEVQEALREERQAAARVHRERHQRKVVEAPFVQRPHTYWEVKGDWQAGDVEECLRSPRSSLNPAFILGDEDLS